MGNSDETTNKNNNTHLIKAFSQTKENTKKIKCKEKNFINFINSSNRNNIHSFQNNFNYSKTVKIKNNISFQKMPFQNEEIIYKNIYNNGDLMKEKNIDLNNNEKNKDKKFINAKTKTNNNYQSYNNLKNFFIKDENNKIDNNNFHLIKSEKKLINLKQNYNMNLNNLNNLNINNSNSNLLTTTNKTFIKSKNIFNKSNTNEFISNEHILNKLSNNEFSLCKTENNFYNKKIKNQTKQIKLLINNNHELSNKSTKIKNIFVKQKTQKKFGPINLKLDTNNKIKDDVLYIKSNNKIIINNNSIINKDNKDNNVISYIYNPNTNKNYKISKQNEKKNFININKISKSQKKLYNFENNYTRSENILYNNINNHQEKKLNKTNPNIKLCNNQIIYNDNKNIFIQNNYINGRLHTSNEISQSGNIKKQIYIKNKSFDSNHPQTNNNYITNLKNLLPTSENFKNALKNIKNIFLGNEEKINNKTEEEKNKEININYNNNNNKINEKNFEDKSSIIDDSIILNSSDVYGTLNLSKTLNNLNNSNKNLNEDEIKEPKDGRKKPKEINKIKKDENSNENEIYINPYSNYRETITLNMNLNKKKTSQTQKEKEYKKIMISEIIKHNNKSHKKENIKEYLTTNINNNINNTNNKIPKDNTNKIINDINNYKHFSVISIPGKNFGVRKTNQDTPVASFGINGIEGFNIFGVLDGHGTNGHYVSKFLGKYLVNNISKNKEILSCLNLEQIYQVIKKSNYEMLINIFLKADTALSKQNFDVSFSGSTCVLVIQIGKKILCANVGDSRAILVYNNNSPNKKGQNTSVYNLSHDFKPDLPEEKKRIYKMGGVVEQMTDMNGMKAGPPRVWGVGKSYPGLAMSRSLGDFKGKKYGIISLPEIIEVNLDENVKYIVACSDGVWEFLSNENVMEIGNEFYEKNDVAGFTRKLAEISESLWEQRDVIVDDITAVVVFY